MPVLFIEVSSCGAYFDRMLTKFSCTVLICYYDNNHSLNRAFLKMKHSANNTFFINLALVYTLVAVLVQPFSMYLVGVQTLQEPLPSIAAFLCQITGATFEVAIYTSLFSLTSISLDR